MALTHGNTYANLAPRGVDCALVCSLKDYHERSCFKARGRWLSDCEGDTQSSYHRLKHPARGNCSLEQTSNGKSHVPDSRVRNLGKVKTDTLAGIRLLHWLLTTWNNIAYMNNFIRQLYLLISRSVQYRQASIGFQLILFGGILAFAAMFLDSR